MSIASDATGLEGQGYQRGRFVLSWWLAERPLAWIAPLAIMLSVFYLFPTLDVIRFSMTDATLLGDDYNYTLESYGRILSDSDLPLILRVTFIFVVASVVAQLFLGLLIAMVIERGARRKLKGTVLLRIVILTAWIVPGVSAGIIWQLLLSEANYGFLNGVLNYFGMSDVAWLSDPDIAIWSAILANTWRGTAFTMILLYAGLQVIPRSLYDAAAVDGASAWRQFWYITLPQLRSILLINTILISIFTLNTFDLILPLTGGGPGRATEVISLYTYNVVFRNFDLSSGSVLAVLMLLISIAFTLAYLRLMPKEND